MSKPVENGQDPKVSDVNVHSVDNDAGVQAANAQAAAAILALVRARGTGKSICPTEAARVLAGGETDDLAWRRHLPAVRRAAMALARSGSIDILRKGKVIAPEDVHGVIRLRIRSEGEKDQ